MAEAFVRGEPVSDTPRSDAEQEHASNVALWISTGKHGYTEASAAVVPIDFARTLERELTESQRQAALYAKDVQMVMAQRDKWKSCAEALAYSVNLHHDSKHPVAGCVSCDAVVAYEKLKSTTP